MKMKVGHEHFSIFIIVYLTKLDFESNTNTIK